MAEEAIENSYFCTTTVTRKSFIIKHLLIVRSSRWDENISVTVSFFHTGLCIMYNTCIYWIFFLLCVKYNSLFWNQVSKDSFTRTNVSNQNVSTTNLPDCKMTLRTQYWTFGWIYRRLDWNCFVYLQIICPVE